jgi:type II secretory pathway predicted ATPase ExeA
MSHGQFASLQSSPFNDLPDQRFIYSNPQQREALATLRYGIETRKGLILFIGDAGTGKSTLLRELTRELDANVVFTLILDPHLSSAEIFRCLLRRLQVTPESADEAALLRQCLMLLRSLADSGRIIAVAFDDAHHLRDKVIEQFVNHFVGAVPADPQKHLVQIILAGRPELKERLFRPPLQSIGSLVATDCRLPGLNDKEVREYIRHQLRAADQSVYLFDDDALQSIAVYSGGKPGLINAICERAFKTVDGPPCKPIHAGVVEGAAKDLALWQPRWIRKQKTEKPHAEFIVPDDREHDESTRLRVALEDSTETVGQTFLHFSGATDAKPKLNTRSRGGKQLSAFFFVAVLAVAAGWMHGDLAKPYLGDWNAMLVQITGASHSAPEQPKAQASTTPETAPHAEAPPPEPSTLESSAPKLDPDPSEIPPLEKLHEPVTPAAPAKNPPGQESKVVPVPTAPAKRRLHELSDKPPMDLAGQISRAIEDRAIAGIRVTMKDDVAYLDGRVATERQRRAAERAARDVADVRAVRNRIVVE